MIDRRLVWAAALCVMAAPLVAQQSAGEGQSPRQAIREMFFGGQEAFKRHLTLEVQAKINDQLKTQGTGNPVQAINSFRAASGQDWETFDSGPILFSLNNAQQHERVEIRVDGDDFHGDEDEMELSLHAFRNGVEEDLPIAFRLLLNWQRQQGIWRVIAITVSASFPLGDPRILDKSFWNPPAFAMLSGGTTTPAASPAASSQTEKENVQAKRPIARSVRLIGMAENLYAQKHPDQGFTCSLPELVGIGKGFDNESGSYRFMDPEFAQGSYNGYRFTLSGCTGKTVKGFHVVAEPLNGEGRAYCSDQTRDLRASDDGSGATCLASGKLVRQ
jgi:hypothetical protein